MTRLSLLILSTAVLGLSPAWAMRAHDYVDADQRASVTLQHERARTTTIEATLDPAPATAPATQDADLLPPHPQGQAATPPPAVSTVPEPSGSAMLICGLVLLLLQPHKHVERFKDAKKLDA